MRLVRPRSLRVAVPAGRLPRLPVLFCHVKDKYRGKICVSACAAHTLDLLLEDIGKLKRFANTIVTMRVIGKVIMNHAAIRHEYKDKNGGKELDRYCDTRFGTCCIMCESAKENRVL